jgi:Oxidoreductase FAD-binding domain
VSRRGHFDLVVKVYPKGNISKYLGDMKEGDTIEAKGPIQKLPYKANMKKKIGMIAGACRSAAPRTVCATVCRLLRGLASIWIDGMCAASCLHVLRVCNAVCVFFML